MRILKIAFINLGLFLFFCGALEGIFTLWQRNQPSVTETFSWREAYYLAFNFEEFLQRYEDQMESNRLIPQKNSNPKTRVFFLGCSLTYGNGVEPSEAMPALFSHHTKTTEVLNMGLPGFGPNENAQLMKNITIEEKVFKKNIAIYSFFSDHINRATLGWSHLWWSHPATVNHYVEEDGVLKGGDFLPRENYPLFLLNLLVKTSETIRFFANRSRTEAPMTKFPKKKVLFTMKVIKRIEENFKARFPDGEFFLFLLDPSLEKNIIKPIADDLGIKILNPDHYFSTNHILPDNHFNPQGNQEFALAIINSLKKKGISFD